jgi:signal transduction histidine kinase/HAMP domain-containing protein
MIQRLYRKFASNSLRAHLLALVLASLLPLLVFAVAMVVFSARSEREVVERGAIERTRALTTAVDSELNSSIRTLEALATSRDLDSADLQTFYDDAARVLRSQSVWQTILLSRPSGEPLMNLLRPLGTVLPRTFDQRSFDRLVETQRPAVGDIRFGPLNQKYGFVIRVPVMRDGQLAYVLSAVHGIESMNALLSPQRLPASWIAAIFDVNGNVVARTISADRYVGRPASAPLLGALSRAAEGWILGATLEGWPVYSAFSRSQFTGWTVAIGIPADVVDGGFRRSLAYLVLFGGGLLALGLLIAWFLASRTSASIASLSAVARQVSSGEPAVPVAAEAASGARPTRIAEVETVRDALLSAHRLLAEEAIEKERLAVRLQLALAAGDIGVHEWHPETNELIWDDRVRAHWGLSPGAPVDFAIFRQGLHSEDRGELETALKRALDPRSGGEYHAEFRVIGIDDHVERWIEASGRVMFENGKPVRLTGTTLDVSPRKSFQAELERQVLERTVRLEETIGELEAFSYSVSHDMRAPLRAMEGYSKALVEDYGERLDSQAKIYLDRIVRSARRLDSLIKDVLAYSRVAKEEIMLTPVEVTALIDDVIASNPEYQQPYTRVIIHRPLDRVLGHEAYLTQCVTNLLANAVKFVTTGVVPEIRIRSEQFNGKVRLWFEDNGVGIDPAHHERIFQIFGQVHAEGRYAGTGIGLAIVRKAVQRMNGELGVESELGKGSCFWFTLDAAEDGLEKSAQAQLFEGNRRA